MKILIDTHTLIWARNNTQELSSTSKNLMSDSDRFEEMLISSFSFWEIAMLIRKNRLQFPNELKSWIRTTLDHPKIRLIDVNPDIAIESQNLPGKFHGDPADQIIVATARLEGATIITKDRKIREYTHVKSLW